MPNLPDEALEPESVRMVATVLASTVAAMAVVWLVLVGVGESKHSSEPALANAPQTSSVPTRGQTEHTVSVAAEMSAVPIEVDLAPLEIPNEIGLTFDPSLQPYRRGFWARYWLFIVTVAAPMALVAYFLLVVAAPRYNSSASFIIRSSDNQSSQSALSSFAASSGSAAESQDTFAVDAYLQSRDVVSEMAEHNSLRSVLGRPQADFVFRFPTFWLPNDDEYLYRRFQWMVYVNLDPVTSITSIEVNAFTPEDAQAVARALVRSAEALVNRMNDRAYKDLLKSADAFVAELQKRVDGVEDDLKQFRNSSGSIDPSFVSQAKLTVIEGLATQLAQINATIIQQTNTAPTSPRLPALREQAKSYRIQIEKLELEIAGAAGSEATKLETYEQLILRRDLDAKALANAVAQRDLARQDALRQHLYLQLITQPNLSVGYAAYPQSALDLAVLFVICMAIYLSLKKMRGIALEHRP